MSELIRSGWRRLVAFLFVWRKVGEKTTDQAPNAEVGSPRPSARKRHGRADEDAERCYYEHIEDLLTTLPLCHKLLRKLKSFDRSAYEFHRRVGARILPETTAVRWRSINKWAGNLPSQGIVFFNGVNKYIDGFIYFQKVKTGLWTSTGTVYEVTIVYCETDKPACGFSFYVVIADGQARAVPMPTVHSDRIVHRDRGARRHGRVSVVRRGSVELSPYLVDLYNDRKEAGSKLASETVAEYGGGLLLMALNIWSAGRDEWQFSIRASKSNVVTRFDVAVSSPKRFFKDRAIEVAADGRRKRIIHWVSPHDRVLADGRMSSVKGHFRGADRFDWNGFAIQILMPRNRFDVRNFDVVGEYLEEIEDPASFVDIPTVGRKLVDYEVSYGRRESVSMRDRKKESSPAHNGRDNWDNWTGA